MESPTKFFYVEDDHVLAQVTERALVKRNFDVTHFSTLTEANTYCEGSGKEQISEFDYVLLDLKLDDGISLPLIDIFLKKNPAVKILVLTGYASIATAVQAVKMGATNYLAKPATVDDILRAFEGEIPPTPEAVDDASDEMSLRRREWETIQSALAANSGNISATARQLKMHRRTLQRKLQKKPVTD